MTVYNNFLGLFCSFTHIQVSSTSFLHSLSLFFESILKSSSFKLLLGQDQVSESDRCVVGAVQNSLQSILDLLGYVMGIIISHPRVIVHNTYFFTCLLLSIFHALHSNYQFVLLLYLISRISGS